MFDQTGADEGAVSWRMSECEGVLSYWTDHPGPLCVIVICCTAASQTWQLGCELCASILVHSREPGSSELALVWPIGACLGGWKEPWLACKARREAGLQISHKELDVDPRLSPSSSKMLGFALV